MSLFISFNGCLPACCLLLTVTVFSISCFSASVHIDFKNQHEEILENALVMLHGNFPTTLAPGKGRIDQINKEYVPKVIVVQQGTQVYFPNKDNIRHHVYSFSKAKSFELPLYEGTPTKPVVFDQSGAVVLGCNIHDWMRGYIYVSKTPYFALSNKKGLARIKNIPAGEYIMEFWHPNLLKSTRQQRIELSEDRRLTIKKRLEIRPEKRLRRAPRSRRRRYEE